jgi:AraC-like DNA-binding protein
MSRASSPSTSTPALTSIAFVKSILLAYERYGVAPDQVLESAQIPPALLDDPDGKITAAQLEVFTAGAMRELDDETLGWFSRKLHWGTYGMLCRASLGSPDLGTALRRWFHHHGLLTRDIVIVLTVKDDIATVEIEEHREFGAMRELCLLTYLRFVHGYACWAVDSRIDLLEVRLPFARPPHGALYPRLFPGPVFFEKGRAGFSFDAKYLALPHARDQSSLRAMLQRPLLLTILQYRRDRLLVSRIKTLLTTSPDHLSGAEAIAQQLNVSSRTMYRQLQEEGTSFQKIKDEVRKERALRMLANTAKPIKQVAHALGFSSDKSFSRAFREWHGESPHEYRLRLKQEL